MRPKYVGTVAHGASEEFLKRGALLFDEIVFPRLEAEFEPLLKHGIARPDSEALITAALSKAGRQEGELLEAAIDELSNIFSSPDAPDVAEKLKDLPDEHVHAVHLQVSDLLARVEAAYVGSVLRDDIVLPLVYNEQLGSGANPANRAAIARIVLDELPMPPAATPWEAIADWRADPEAREKYQQLRSWMAQTARAQAPIVDVLEEMAAKLASYDRYMSLQHRKFGRGRLHTVILLAAGALTDLATLRLPAAIDKLLGVFKDEVMLLESEMRAPGREIAYIAVVNQRFRK